MVDDTRGKHDEGKLLYCSFCGKSQHEVRKLIAGPSVFVCDECVELCNDIIREELEEKQERSRDKLPRPAEIKKVLDDYVIGQERAKKILSVAVYLVVALALGPTFNVLGLGAGTVENHCSHLEDWDVNLVDTGAATQTGGRIRRLQPFLQDDIHQPVDQCHICPRPVAQMQGSIVRQVNPPWIRDHQLDPSAQDCLPDHRAKNRMLFRCVRSDHQHGCCLIGNIVHRIRHGTRAK